MKIYKENTKMGCPNHDGDKHNEGYLVDDVLYSIDNAPAVDVVPVVRCKDCKHAEWWGNFEYNIGQYFCEFMDANVELKGDDFCSRGERRETDDG
jgi:hypothetical protein